MNGNITLVKTEKGDVKLKIILCGHMYDDAETEVKKMSVPNTISGHKFQMNLLMGLMENIEDVYVVNTSRVRFFPHYPEKIIKEKDFLVNGKAVGKSVGFVNLLGINYITRYIGIQKELKKYINDNIKDNEKCVLVCFNCFFPITLSMFKCKHKYKNVYTCAVIGDIHGKYGVSPFDANNFFKGALMYFIGILSDKSASKFDCLAFLTKDMARALKVENKPFVVMEGMYNVSHKNEVDSDLTEESDLKIIFYAGSLREEYGILHLIKAFEMIDNSEYRLYLAGGGGTEKHIKECAEKDNRINFLGYITPQEVDKWQKKATVLVSPRTAESNEYVKYSFPSKTMECLASGKPYIAHRLPCDPPEYANYIQYADDESDEALAEKINEICSMPSSERDIIGAKAKKFIEEEKNPAVMTKRIVKMLEDMAAEK